MEDSDRTAALKVAYAEIILNTAKEAAARVMLSERRAASFQHELSCSKEESLRLLLRLKHMIDAKTIEAETTSFDQKRKIDELEAQLQEAEDIITDLRGEINCLQDKLERVRNTQVQPLSEQITGEDAYSLEDAAPEHTVQSPLRSGYVTVKDSDMRNSILSRVYPDNRCCNESNPKDHPYVSHYESSCPHKSVLASVLLTSKKPELHINGCTQQVCAVEDNLLNGETSPGSLDDQHSFSRKESVTETSAEDERESMQSSPKTKNMKTMYVSGEETKNFVKVHTLRRGRKSRFRRIKAASRTFRPGQQIKPCESSSVLSHCRTYTVNRNVKPDESSCNIENIDIAKNSRELEEELQHKSSDCRGDTVASYKGKAKSSIDVSTSFKSLPDQLTESCHSTMPSYSKTLSSVCFNLKKNEDESRTNETETQIKPLLHLDTESTLNKCNMDSLSGIENVAVAFRELDKSRFVQSALGDDMKSGDESLLVGQECDSEVISTLPSSEMNSSMVNVSSLHSDLKNAKASNITIDPSTKVESSNDRLKYTFQRKRKKESISDPDERLAKKAC